MTTTDYNVQNIEQALHQLYYSPSADALNTAQHWLTRAQRANEAWQFAWELLQEEKATEVQYFGASALISKMSGSWSDIQENEIFVLRDRLFDEILKYCSLEGKQIVLTRLCVAFSTFLANCAIRQIWPSAISEIIGKLQGEQGSEVSRDQHSRALLEILTIIPEEFHASRMEKYKKGLMLNFLRNGQPQVFQLLTRIFYEPSMKVIRNHVIKCVSMWVALGVPLNEYDQLLISILDCVKSPETFDSSVECMLNVFSNPSAHDYSTTLKTFVPLVVSLQPLFQTAVNNEDADSVLGLTKLFCSFAENHPKLILETFPDPSRGLGLLSLILDCASVPLQYPSEEWSSPFSFTFWCSLQDEIQALPPDQSFALKQQLLPYFFELVNRLLQKVSYPKNNAHEKWNAEEKEQHRIYRVDVSDVFMYMLEMLGGNVLMFIFNKLEVCMRESATKEDKPWHEIESCLFGIHSVVETLSEYDTDVPCLQKLAEMLPLIYVNSLQLADTMLYTIGTLTEWLTLHPEKLFTLTSFVLSCLSNSELTLSAVLTLRRVTRECNEELIPYAGPIMKQTTDFLLKGVLRRNEETWLMQAVGHVLSVVPREDCLNYLQNLLVLEMQKLEALSTDEISAPNKNSIKRILDLLSSLFSTLDRRREENSEFVSEEEEQPVITLLRQLLPIFKNILNIYVTDAEIVETLCNLFDRTIRSLVDDFVTLVPSLCEILCIVFQNYPYPCILDLSQQIVLVFGRKAPEENGVLSLFQTLISTAMLTYKSKQIENHPDIAQSFMQFLSFSCRKCFVLYTTLTEKNGRSVLLDIFKCGIMTLQLPDSQSANSASSFVRDFIFVYSTEKAIASVIDECIMDLLLVILQGIGGKTPRTAMNNFADVMYGLCRANLTLYSRCLNELILRPDIPCARVEQTQKTAFVKLLLREVKSKRRYRDMINEFTFVCRGFHGTEYAAS